MDTDFRLANYFILYVATLLFFAVGAITTLGLGWYQALVLPAWTPSTTLVAVIWCALFALAALSAIKVWDKIPRGAGINALITLYAGNALLVLLWNYLFFGLHEIFPAFLAALLVSLSVLILVASASRISRAAAWLLAPYLAWALFASYLLYVVSSLNR